MKYIHMFSAYLNEVKVMNEKNKKVCAVVVTYNRKELLCRNIKSLLKQTYPVDILIYDNASTDGTEDELNNGGYLAMPNIIYVKGKYNGGVIIFKIFLNRSMGYCGMKFTSERRVNIYFAIY